MLVFLAQATAILLPAGAAHAALSAAEESKVMAVKGADLFKKGQFLDAAQAFEKAYALDAKDFRVLRYAGRAWQEVGFYDRALKLLTRYLEIETDAELVQSAKANVAKLKATTPAERAAALDQATRKYPQARLEDEAAKAYEALGDAKSLERAIELWEVVRVATPDESGKRYVDDHMRKLREQVQAMQAAAAGKAPGVTQQAEPSHTLQYAVWGASGLALIGGVSLMAVAAGQTKTSNDEYTARTIGYSAYRDQRSAADTLYYAGIGLTVLGAGGAVAGFFLGPPAHAKASTWHVVPASGGLAVAGSF
ncbi:MAG: tetratricopeptide repeat protein [Deltaproteobacteria bacterium]|nr:tetratricopeptide repeat protein [Deltaproteobacteria bacterium]